jgi:hypothetical protein
LFEGAAHAGDGGEVAEEFVGCADDDFLGEFVVVVEVREEGEEGVVVEDADVVGLVLVEDVGEVDLEEALQQHAEDAVQPVARLRTPTNTSDRYTYAFPNYPGTEPYATSSSRNVEKKF